MDTYKTLGDVRRVIPVVDRALLSGGTCEDALCALATAYDKLVDRVMLLEGIAPRKIQLSDGRVMVYQCPIELVPEIKL